MMTTCLDILDPLSEERNSGEREAAQGRAIQICISDSLARRALGGCFTRHDAVDARAFDLGWRESIGAAFKWPRLHGHGLQQPVYRPS